MSHAADILIVGSGIGGATLAHALAPSGLRILILERGARLADTAEARDDAAIFARGHYRPDEEWLTSSGEPFNPGTYYCVGGNSKFYGAAMLRYRESDFAPTRHMGGTTPGWPFDYAQLEPWYGKAEALYGVRGAAGEDPTEPPRSTAYPHPPVPDEPDIAALRARLRKVGLHPSALPLAVDLDRWLARAATPWDAFPETAGGKIDAETGPLAQALTHPNVRLETGARVVRLVAGPGGILSGVELERSKQRETLTAPLIVLASGAVNSAALLLGSATEHFPNGLSNSSGAVGRHFMNHNCSGVLALHPLRRNRAIYQKTLQINDFYASGGPSGEPLGNIQMLGKVSGTILAASSGLPRPIANWISERSYDFYAMSEDLPNPESRVTLKAGQIVLDWKRSNWAAHEALVAALKRRLRRAGFPVVLSKAFDRRTPSHQCGTARMGADPATSVLDTYCRSHDHPNLYVMDASFLPTSAAVNPSLTIAAQALRVGAHIRERMAG